MKSFLLGAALVALAAGSAGAAADPLETLYKNTVVVTVPGYGDVLAYIDKDGAYRHRLPGGVVEKGNWTRDGDKICSHITDPKPPPGSKPSCEGLVGKKVGDKWSTATPGGKYVYSIKAGR